MGTLAPGQAGARRDQREVCQLGGQEGAAQPLLVVVQHCQLWAFAWGVLSSSLSRPQSQPCQEPVPSAAPQLIRLSDYTRSWN